MADSGLIRFSTVFVLVLVMAEEGLSQRLKPQSDETGRQRSRPVSVDIRDRQAELSSGRVSRADKDDESDDSDEDDDDEEDDGNHRGPWKVQVPKVYQKGSYSLRIGPQWRPLSTSEIVLTPRELPQYISLIDRFGRVEYRRRKAINPHLLTGFRSRMFRLSAWGGAGTLRGHVMERYGLNQSKTFYGANALYQPGPLGYGLGLEAMFADTETTQMSLLALRIGATFETGLFYRSSHYRWHQLFQGGIAVGPILVRDRSAPRTSNSQAEREDLPVMARGSAAGPYASVDSLYMFQNWWWGGRLSLAYLMTQTQPEETQTTAPQEPPPDQDTAVPLTGTLLGLGIALVASVTW